jgi:FAD/FMN-containing dehydrogenase
MITRRSFLLSAGGAALAATALPGSARAQTLSAGSARARTAFGVNWNQLSSHLQGKLVLPSDANYPTAKLVYTAQFDSINPGAIAYCASPADVALCLGFAQDHALPFAARSGGHSAGGYSLSPGLVIDVSGLNSVTLGQGTATIGAGAELVDITNTLAPAGLAISGGYCPTVAAGGFLQGGGIGLFTRSMGIACDKVTSVQVVLADGRVVTASPQQHSDLYWALRGGGGGNFGIVTSYTFTPTPLTDIDVSLLSWPYDQALDVVDGWTQWMVDGPSTIGGGLNVTLANAAAGNVPVVSLILACVDASAGFGTEIDRLVSLIGHSPATQQTLTAPYEAIMMGQYNCTDLTEAQCHLSGSSPVAELPRPAFGLERGRMFNGPISRDGWAKALAVLDTARLAGQEHLFQVTALGGAANTLSRSATAYVHRDALFMASYITENAVPPVSNEAVAAGTQFVDAGFAALNPYSNGETYQNFIDPRLPDWERSYYAENYPRLMQVKSVYDPHNAFRFAQSIRLYGRNSGTQRRTAALYSHATMPPAPA